MNNDRTLAIIGLHVDANQQVHIEDCESVHEVWVKLELLHEPRSRIHIMHLKKEFYHLKMKDNANMPSYVSRSKIVNNLREASAETKETLHILY